MHSKPKMILNYLDRSDQVQFITITREKNDVSDCTDAVYVENNTKMS